MTSWQNENGEPFMTAAELNFEAELDDHYAAFAEYDDDYPYGYDEGDYPDYA